MLTRIGWAVLSEEQGRNEALSVTGDSQDRTSPPLRVYKQDGPVQLKKVNFSLQYLRLDFALYFEISLAPASPTIARSKWRISGAFSRLHSEKAAGLLL